MQRTRMIRATVGWIGCLIGFLALGALAVDPAVGNVVARQRWPWSRLVDIDYVLTCAETQRVDIAITGYNGEAMLSLSPEALSGNIYGVSNGTRRIVLDPARTAYTNELITQFRVDLRPLPVPLYMIVDLTNAVGKLPQIEYVYEEDLVTNKWGTWERDAIKTNGVVVVESVIWTGVTNDPAYKTDRLVLRRIPAGSFKMGWPNSVETQVAKDFYMGVFEVTQAQWKNVTGSYPNCYFTNTNDRATRPVENEISYEIVRGAVSDAPTVNWPETGSYVKPTSFLGKLRTKTGVSFFDLPTGQQWEYACRAGTATYYNDGIAGTPNAVSNAQLNVLGRYKWNGGYYWDATSGSWKSAGRDSDATNGSATVGSYKANAWGLYDTHGNVWEHCLEWYTPETYRTIRGGGLLNDASLHHAASSTRLLANLGSQHAGVRLVIALP